MKISSRQSGAVGLERGFSLMMEKYPFQKKSENKVRETCSSGYLRVSCPETAGGKGTERGRVFFVWDGWLHFPKSESGMCVCVPDLPPLWKCEIVHFWTVRITQRGGLGFNIFRAENLAVRISFTSNLNVFNIF